MTHQIQSGKLASVSLGHRILTPDGLSHPVAGVRWRDAIGAIIVIQWDTGHCVEAAGAQIVQAVVKSQAHAVSQHDLDRSPRPIWTGVFPEELLRLAWPAHMAGERATILDILEPLLGQDQKCRPDAWPAAATGLALYSFTASSLGNQPAAVAAANELVAGLRRRNPRTQRPAMIRYRLAYQLPTESLTARLHETLQRWALATAYGLPTSKHEKQHLRDLNRLRAALAEQKPAVGRRPRQTPRLAGASGIAELSAVGAWPAPARNEPLPPPERRVAKP